jgi:hypothetical protein
MLLMRHEIKTEVNPGPAAALQGKPDDGAGSCKEFMAG